MCRAPRRSATTAEQITLSPAETGATVATQGSLVTDQELQTGSMKSSMNDVQSSKLRLHRDKLLSAQNQQTL
jgi:hypothetical protein